MRLSEAIRLGAMLKRQAFGAIEDEDGNTCALGAAYDAIGELHRGQGYDWSWACRRFPVLKVLDGSRGRPKCFLCGTFVESIIPHLNDFHRWTRERIADWIQTLESADEPRASPETADAVREDVEPPVVSTRV